MSETVERNAQPPDRQGSDDTGRLEGASNARLFGIVAIIVMFSEVVPLMYTVVTPSVPKVGASFSGAGSSVSWMLVIVGLVGGAISPLIGKLADLYGKKRLLLVCSGFFILGSIVCATSTIWGLFLAGRAMQAVAMGMTAVVYSLIRDLMPRRLIPIAIGVSATGFGLSAVIGPIIAGALTDHFSWRSLFWFLAILMAVATPLLAVFVPESKLRVKQRLDYVGAAALGAGVAMVLLYLSMGAEWGWAKPSAWGWALGGVVVIALWVLWEKNQAEPLIDIKLLTAPKVAFVIAAGFLANFMIGGQNYLTAYMAENPKSDTLKATIAHSVPGLPTSAISFDGSLSYALGLSMMGFALHLTLAQSITSMAFGPLGGRWGQKTGLRNPLIAGLGVMSIAALMYMFMYSSWVTMMICGIVWGVGFGLYYAAAPNLMIEAVPQEQQGVSAGMLTVGSSFGSSVGVALMSPIFSSNKLNMTMNLGPGGSHSSVVPQVFTTHAYTTGFLMLLIVGIIGVAVAVLMKTGRTGATGGLGHLADEPVAKAPVKA